MKLSDSRIAYQLQKKFNNGSEVVAYKVGASNYRSADFFSYDGVLLGGITKEHVIYEEIQKDYSVAEVEVIDRVNIDRKTKNGYRLISRYIGIECPNLTVENPNGSAFICIADNCSAGDLIVYQEIDMKAIKKVSIFVNGKLKTIGSSDNLRFNVEQITSKAVSVIMQNNLDIGSGDILIATGGLTDTFSINKGDNIEFKYE